MISRFDEFIQLSSYFKHYELYQKFLDMHVRHREARNYIDINSNAYNIQHSCTPGELEKYNIILKKLAMNTQVLETQFQNFDFSEKQLLDARNDYELLSYEFLMDMFQSFIQEKSFDTPREFISYVYSAERVIKKYFMRKFYVFENLDKVFVKIIDTLLDKYYTSSNAKKLADIECCKEDVNA